MNKKAWIPLTATVASFVALALTGNLGNLRLSAASISPLALAAGILAIAWDFCNADKDSTPSRAVRNDDIPDLADEEFFAHHKLFGTIFAWYAIPLLVPTLYFSDAGKLLLSLGWFLAAYIGVGFYTKYKFRTVVDARRRQEQRELENQIKRESGWS
ncbi:MAG: hypothetical protein ACI4V1_08420 [Eubacteriales bacterium]